MTYQTKALGNQAEQLAATWLQHQKKYQILAQNLKTKLGEIDILARDGRALVVVEVKAKTSDSQGTAIEMITPKKQQKLILLAHQLQSQYQTNNVRIDAVAVDQAADQPIMKLYRGVVEFYGF